MSFTSLESGLYRGDLHPEVGALRRLWRDFGARVVVGHPTFRNRETVGRQLAEGIQGCAKNFPGRKVAFVVSDGTWTRDSPDLSTIEEALGAARRALGALAEDHRSNLQVVVTPYEGYARDSTPGKGSALKMVFDEMEGTQAELLILLDGDLRNDMAQWQGVFARVEAEHHDRFGTRPFFVTARYARHFVDASLTRFIVGPLTTLMGRYVPGGISGDICLSAGAVARERESPWSDARRRYGTDISTTFDNIAHAETVIYEVYLGAKLHDITDEAKLAVMPAQVIGAALERLVHWEAEAGVVSRNLLPEATLAPLEKWGPARTGIDFVDPGYTDVFQIDQKIQSLVERFPDYREAIEEVHGTRMVEDLRARVDELQGVAQSQLQFLNIHSSRWIDVLLRTVAYCLNHGELDVARHSLSYLYTAAFLEFVRERLADLGLHNIEAVRQAQPRLGVAPDQAVTFYADKVDARVDAMALDFFERRERIRYYRT